MDFFYDASGYPFAVKYNGDLCYYITNLQGDVMSIVDAQGELVAEYEYDPYGNIVSQSGPLADVNPLRYRGYVYDTETQFYYLQSRYYDPELGRFLNADSYASTGQGVVGHNMFAYCNNGPVNFADSNGCTPLSVLFCAIMKESSGLISFDSEEEAAIEAGVRTRDATNRDDHEYICGVYKLDSGGYSIGKCYKGNHASANTKDVLEESLRYNDRSLVAVVHSHPYCTGHIPNEFSQFDSNGNITGDLKFAFSSGIPLYLAAPNGKLYVLYTFNYIQANEFVYFDYNIKEIYEGLPSDNTIINCRK